MRPEIRRTHCCWLALLLCCGAAGCEFLVAATPSLAQETASGCGGRRHPGDRGASRRPGVVTQPAPGVRRDPPPAEPVPPAGNPAAKRWAGEELVKEIADGGIALVSLAFAAFTFLYAALLTLKDEDSGDSRVQELRRKIKTALRSTAAAVTSSTVMTGLAFASLVTGNRAASVVTICLAGVILLGLSGVAWFLAHDVFAEGRNA